MSTNATRRAALVWIGAFPAAAAVPAIVQASPMPISTAHWDRALERYLEAREAYDRDLKHGDLRRAYVQHEARADFAIVSAAEEVHHERFGQPMEAALHALMLTAAPTMLALRQKVWIAQQQLIEDVGDDRRPILSVIADDLTRLAAGKGA